jgi:hypothetical protein
MSTLRAAALGYAGAGIPVFPLHSVTDERCSCGKYPCGPGNKAAGKHPRTSDGFYSASTDRAAIEKWWSKWPDANIGTPYFDAVDFDSYKDGAKETFARLRPLIAKTTPTTTTGGGGQQFLYEAGTLSRGVLGVGVDSRYAGANYIILPPSGHRSGKRYEWKLRLDQGRLAPAPDFPLSDSASGKGEDVRDRAHAGELIEMGRNKAAFKKACSEARWTDDEALIVEAVQAWVNHHCRDPHEVDVAKQVKGALKLSKTESLNKIALQTTDTDSVSARAPDDPDTRTSGEPGPAFDVVLAAVERFIKSYVVLSDSQAVATTLFVVHTWAIDAAETSPYLAVTSPEKRSGKTRLLEVLELLVRSPIRAANVSDAALFRLLAEKPRTLLFDKIDAIFNAKGNREDLRALLNAGYRRGAPAYRVVGEGSKMRVEPFECFGPKVLSGIGSLPDTIADRAFPIRLKRKTSVEVVERFRDRDARASAEPIREWLTWWSTEEIERLEHVRVELPSALDDRAQDAAEPLLAIAHLAGGKWPKRAKDALVALRKEQGEQCEQPDGIRLLTDIRDAIEGLEEISTADLLYALFRVDTSPWAHWWGETRHGEFGETTVEPSRAGAMKLARTLRPFGVRPGNLGGRIKGYRVADFQDAFSRYLTPEVVQVVQTQQSSQKSDIRDRPETPSVDDLEEPVFGSKTANGRPGRPQPRNTAESACVHPVLWLARDGKRRCMECEPSAFPGEIIETSESA